MSNNQSFSDFTITLASGENFDMDTVKDRPILVVNTATKCGLTPQFDALEELWQEYRDQGLMILGFPCNQFGNQNPESDEETTEVCRMNHGVTFPLTKKVDVNGDDADPLFVWLRSQTKGLLGDKVKWNFTKFLVQRDGKTVKRFAPTTKPESLRKDIEAALAK
ncbi:glutathione peroxidase [Boudabousia marimammalium]|uniref:Glutathione peroxidase n=1 Tax=Boudabousia marimammalium TaxID=156892 RepID=A0A1Q5PSA8_9ACTO|nr:glutathione peroxidase [Boudabousia marimammalium]OKL50322.1 glutathione peroxidase [Boudabousia marimammalium]